jgi:hypothetical protein
MLVPFQVSLPAGTTADRSRAPAGGIRRGDAWGGGAGRAGASERAGARRATRICCTCARREGWWRAQGERADGAARPAGLDVIGERAGRPRGIRSLSLPLIMEHMYGSSLTSRVAIAVGWTLARALLVVLFFFVFLKMRKNNKTTHMSEPRFELGTFSV